MRTEQTPSGNVGRTGRLSRYDLLLGSLPLPLLAGVVAGLLTPGPFIEELATGALVAALLMGYALFVESPV
jgi:hypothetical protein